MALANSQIEAKLLTPCRSSTASQDIVPHARWWAPHLDLSGPAHSPSNPPSQMSQPVHQASRGDGMPIRRLPNRSATTSPYQGGIGPQIGLSPPRIHQIRVPPYARNGRGASEASAKSKERRRLLSMSVRLLCLRCSRHDEGETRWGWRETHRSGERDRGRWVRERERGTWTKRGWQHHIFQGMVWGLKWIMGLLKEAELLRGPPLKIDPIFRDRPFKKPVS